ncbi:hypothetical protein AOLI_G00051130 [Acnodon oligacanthus]
MLLQSYRSTSHVSASLWTNTAFNKAQQATKETELEEETSCQAVPEQVAEEQLVSVDATGREIGHCCGLIVKCSIDRKQLTVFTDISSLVSLLHLGHTRPQEGSTELGDETSEAVCGSKQWIPEEFCRAHEDDAVPVKCVWQLLVPRNLRKMMLGVVHGAPGMGHIAMGKSTGQAPMWSCTCIVKANA